MNLGLASIPRAFTILLYSVSGVEHRNNACTKGLDPSSFTEFLRLNGRKKRVWQKGAWVEPLMPY